jgi:hypothetical protein
MQMGIFFWLNYSTWSGKQSSSGSRMKDAAIGKHPTLPLAPHSTMQLGGFPITIGPFLDLK